MKADGSLAQTNDELRSIQGVLVPQMSAQPEAMVKFAIDKDASGHVTSVRLVRFDVEGSLLYRWMIWSADAAVTAIDDAPKPEGVELDEPSVTLPADEEQTSKHEKRDKQEGA